MGLGATQLRFVEKIVRPGMKVAQIGRLRARRSDGKSFWNDEYLRHHFDAEVVSFDVSNRDGAENVVDLNVSQDWRPELRNSFDLLIDGGSLEHISNLGVALQNYADLLKPGGLIFLCNPTDGYAGHGFFQFSPEFFYRAFSELNGFTPLVSLLEEKRFSSTARAGYRVRTFANPDPAHVGHRVIFRSRHKVQTLFLAQKTRESSFSTSFIQSDYAASPESPSPLSRKSQGIFVTLFNKTSPLPWKKIRRIQRAKATQRLGVFPLVPRSIEDCLSDME